METAYSHLQTARFGRCACACRQERVIRTTHTFHPCVLTAFAPFRVDVKKAPASVWIFQIGLFLVHNFERCTEVNTISTESQCVPLADADRCNLYRSSKVEAAHVDDLHLDRVAKYSTLTLQRHRGQGATASRTRHSNFEGKVQQNRGGGATVSKSIFQSVGINVWSDPRCFKNVLDPAALLSAMCKGSVRQRRPVADSRTQSRAVLESCKGSFFSYTDNRVLRWMMLILV